MISELANTSFCLTIGQLLRDDADKAASSLRHILSR